MPRHQLVRPFAEPGDEWQYAAASGGIVDNAAVSMKAAVSGKRNYVTGIQITNKDATVGTEVIVKSGSTVIWRVYLAPGSPAALSGLIPQGYVFSTPLKGGTNEAITVECGTTSSETFVNAQGYTA